MLKQNLANRGEEMPRDYWFKDTRGFVESDRRYTEREKSVALSEQWLEHKSEMIARHARNNLVQEMISVSVIIAVSLLFVLTALG